MPREPRLIRVIPAGWSRARVLLIGLPLLGALAILGFSCAQRPVLPGPLPLPVIARPIATDDVFAKAIALARAGFAKEAVDEAKGPVAANPNATLPPELTRLIDPQEGDPFRAARGLAAAGFDDKAKEEAAKQLAARPEHTLPPELRYLSQRPGEVFVDGRLDPLRAWGAIANPRTWLAVAIGDLFIVAVAVLVVLVLVWPLVLRAIERRYRVQAFEEEAASPALGRTIAVLVEDELKRQSEEGGGSRLEFVRTSDAAFNLPEALKGLPVQVAWLAGLLSLVPSNTSVVAGTLHARGMRGVGITVALTSPRGSIAESVTLWEDEFDPRYAPPVTKDAELAAGVAAYQRLALAGATWLLYRLQQPLGGRS